LEESNSLNSTQNSQNSQNPQGTGNPGSSNGSDFQTTAPQDALNEGTENLSVQSTGDPLSGSVSNNANDSLPMSWIIGIFLIIIIGGFIFYKLLRETIEEATSPEPATKPRVVKSPAKKTAASKKSSSNKRKKTSKKRK